jgi:hypothetical protein
MGWSDPTFGSLWLPKGIVGSLQPRKQGKALFAKCFARVQSECRAMRNLYAPNNFASPSG